MNRFDLFGTVIYVGVTETFESFWVMSNERAFHMKCHSGLPGIVFTHPLF